MPNAQLQLAQEFIRSTSHSVFLTGKAGTGKTTFLHRLKEDAPKRMIVTAPTGVAAINAGGVTLHSFFQLPFGPFVPGGEAESQVAERRISRQKREIIQSMALLVIDEISMVRCDLLDAVDFVLRHHRGCDLPFGGVQLLMIGDLHQLPPVVREDDWTILKDFYASGYFFSSRALQATDVVSIALEHIYRQSDADFIDLLNRVRNNRLDEATLERLNTRYQPDFAPSDSDGYITLTTHNQNADRINETRLRALDSKSLSFAAHIQGDYPEHSYPTADTLALKKGAQVMFVRNDSAQEKRYFNGKIGTVTRLERERIVVQCPGDADTIEVESATWENIKYSLDQETKAISEEVIGKFVQYPLRLAWAITIHKSQGLTFERAIIDAGAAFSHGQVYVALSRCKTFEGMVLSAPIPRRAVRTDQLVSHYVDEAVRHPPTQDQLDHARIAYQQRLLQECWDFDDLGARLRKLLAIVRGNRRVIDARGEESIDTLEQQTLDEVVSVGVRFRRQLQRLQQDERTPEDNEHLQERVRKASAYFTGKLQQGLLPWLDAFSFGTDNKALRKALREAIAEFRKALAIKAACVASCREGFSTPVYLDALAKAGIDAESPRPPVEQDHDQQPNDSENPELLAALRRWRASKAEEEERDGVAHYRIMTRAILRQIANTLPAKPEALAAIKGIGKRTVERYGDELLILVADYCRSKGIDPSKASRRQHGESKTKAQEPGTRLITYHLYRDGLGIQEIADRRSLAPSTIEKHLAHYISTGKLSVMDFIDDEKIARITGVLAETGANELGLAKQALGNDCSYGELRMVKAHLARSR